MVQEAHIKRINTEKLLTEANEKVGIYFTIIGIALN